MHVQRWVKHKLLLTLILKPEVSPAVCSAAGSSWRCAGSTDAYFVLLGC